FRPAPGALRVPASNSWTSLGMRPRDDERRRFVERVVVRIEGEVTVKKYSNGQAYRRRRHATHTYVPFKRSLTPAWSQSQLPRSMLWSGKARWQGHSRMMFAKECRG